MTVANFNLHCTEVMHHYDEKGNKTGETISLRADNGRDEVSGKLKLSITNPEMFGRISAGGDLYSSIMASSFNEMGKEPSRGRPNVTPPDLNPDA